VVNNCLKEEGFLVTGPFTFPGFSERKPPASTATATETRLRQNSLLKRIAKRGEHRTDFPIPLEDIAVRVKPDGDGFVAMGNDDDDLNAYDLNTFVTKGYITANDPSVKPSHVQPIVRSYPYKIWLTHKGFDAVVELEKETEEAQVAKTPVAVASADIEFPALSKRQAVITIRMLKSQLMPAEPDDQMIAADALEWMKMKGWVIETTKLSGGRTFQQTTAGRQIAKMSDKQLLADLMGEPQTPGMTTGGVILRILAAALIVILVWRFGWGDLKSVRDNLIASLVWVPLVPIATFGDKILALISKKR